MVVSPYARQGYVDHKTYAFESWLRLVEERFGQNPMTGRDNTANDMTDAFDFTQQPRPPVLMNAKGSPYPLTLQNLAHLTGTLAATNSAYGTYALAPETIASLYGSNLAAAPRAVAVATVAYNSRRGYGHAERRQWRRVSGVALLRLAEPGELARP